MEQVRQLHGHSFRSCAFLHAHSHESLAKCGSRNVILQLVVDDDGAEVEEIALSPGLVECPRRNQPESSRMDCIFQPSQAFFVRTDKQDRHALSVRGASTAVNDKDDYSLVRSTSPQQNRLP